MLKFVVGGQINKAELAELVKKIGEDKISVVVKSDLEAAMDVKNGVVDYYLGACNTGGGGALAMAIALAGADKCATVSMPGKLFPDEQIIAEVEAGKVAFGFTAQHMEQVVPVIMKAIFAKEGV